MAEKIEMRRQLALAAPAVGVEKKQPQQQTRAFPPLPAVVLVSLWGLVNAADVAVNYFIVVSVLTAINPRMPSWMLPPLDEPRDAAQSAKETALLLGFFLSTVPQAAAATLALVLAARRRRVRRALAWVVLAAAIAGDCMYAVGVGIHRVVTRPGYSVFLRIKLSATIFVFAVGDLICLLALLVGSDE